MSNIIPFEGVSKEFQKKVIHLARLKKSLVINLQPMNITVELPEKITILFKCTNCLKEHTIMYFSNDWIKLQSVEPFDCLEEDCKGKCVPELS